MQHNVSYRSSGGDGAGCENSCNSGGGDAGGDKGGIGVDGLDGGINLFFFYDFVSSTEWENLIEPLVGLLRCSLL